MNVFHFSWIVLDNGPLNSSLLLSSLSSFLNLSFHKSQWIEIQWQFS